MTLSTKAPSRGPLRTTLAGFALVLLVRLLTLPRSLWEMDEVLFARAVERFDPLTHRPHPPGYPVVVGLGKLLNLVFHDPFTSLVALSLISSLVGYWALVAAFRRIAGGTDAERVAVAGALLFQLSPAMLVQGPLPMSDPPALMFLALALAAGAILREGGGIWSALALGASASAAIGCRPQLALAVLPMLAVALWQIPGWRRRGEAVAAFTLVSLLWFVPLVVATRGITGFLVYQIKAGDVRGRARRDALPRGRLPLCRGEAVHHPPLGAQADGVPGAGAGGGGDRGPRPPAAIRGDPSGGPDRLPARRLPPDHGPRGRRPLRASPRCSASPSRRPWGPRPWRGSSEPRRRPGSSPSSSPC